MRSEAWARPVRAARRLRQKANRPRRAPRRPEAVIASAAIRTTPVNMSGTYSGQAESPMPTMPVASIITAMIVPQALNRPPRSCVAPRKAAANADSR